MLKIKVDEKDYLLQFKFNSFRHMKNIELPTQTSENPKPFEMMAFLADLFFGAMNWKSDKFYDRNETDEILEQYLMTNEMETFVNSLMLELEESGFFKGATKVSENSVAKRGRPSKNEKLS